MATVRYNNATYECVTAIKGEDYVHLVDANGTMVASFEGVADFSGFEIDGCDWTAPKDCNECNVVVMREDGTFAKSDRVPTGCRQANNSEVFNDYKHNIVREKLGIDTAVLTFISYADNVISFKVDNKLSGDLKYLRLLSFTDKERIALVQVAEYTNNGLTYTATIETPPEDLELETSTDVRLHALIEGEDFAVGYNHIEGSQNFAGHMFSHAEGYGNLAYGRSSHVEGYGTTVLANYGHAEGFCTIAGYVAHAEGNDTIAIGKFSHAQGSHTLASAECAHAEGSHTEASGPSAHSEGAGTKAIGQQSHAQGFNSVAYGRASHASGLSTTVPDMTDLAALETTWDTSKNFNAAIGPYSFVHGTNNLVTSAAIASVAIGNINKVTGTYSGALGHGNTVTGAQAFAIGHTNVVQGHKGIALGLANKVGTNLQGSESEAAFAAGWSNTVDGKRAMAIGQENIVHQMASGALGYRNEVTGAQAFAIGHTNYVASHKGAAIGYACISGSRKFYIYSHVYNSGTNTSKITLGFNNDDKLSNYPVLAGDSCFIYFEYTTSAGGRAQSEKKCTISSISGNTIELDTAIYTGTKFAMGWMYVLGKPAHGSHNQDDGTTIAAGFNTQAIMLGSCALNYCTQALALHSFATGNNTVAQTIGSFAAGWKNKTTEHYQTVVGQISDPRGGDLFVVGGGGSESNPYNLFRVNHNGNAYVFGEYNSKGADYAEYYEWLDSNVDNEDRRGYFVTLDGSKIRKATSEDDYILGIVSANPAVVGNSYDDMWHKKYLTDMFGTVLTESVLIPEETTVIDGKEVVVSPAMTVDQPILNPDYNPDTEYISRADRKEWSIVGTHGQLIVIDDGTCKVNGYCKVTYEGTATISENKTDFRVIERIDDTHIKVVLK